MSPIVNDGSATAHGRTVQPTSELLRLKLLLRCSLMCLLLSAVVVLLLLVSHPNVILLWCAPLAVVDILTVTSGYTMLLLPLAPLDEHAQAQDLPALTGVAGLCCALHVMLALLFALASSPGAIDPCSWLALAVSALLEFLCARLSAKMLQSMRRRERLAAVQQLAAVADRREQAADALLPQLLHVEGGGSGGLLPALPRRFPAVAAGGRLAAVAAAAASSGRGAEEGIRGDPRLAVQLDPVGPAQGSAGLGFAPYQGLAHRLAD